ncbi:MAG: UDP-N-acetylmuramate dehydrogenase [Desulfobulbaceae bacterium]|nr:UDP-N-acetylmuramate dehydrogenase [Desulfobulbaceae bacterium]HIJ79347.1 UDP-N-acetylmuramate dehydrogenase [Deltaproteobacteria bacterium]
MLRPDIDPRPGAGMIKGEFYRPGDIDAGLWLDREVQLNRQWPEQLKKMWQGRIMWSSPMARWCTLQVGGPAKAVALPAGEAELAALLAILNDLAVPWRVIGRGSNILVSDKGYDGVIIVLGREFGAIDILASEVAGYELVRVEAGCGLMRLVNWTVEHGLSGLEFAAGIPGSVGGAVAMNAGAWGAEIADPLSAVTFATPAGKLVRRERAELIFAYRHLEKGNKVVVAAEFLLEKADGQKVDKVCRQLMENRKNKQPGKVASAGSFFKNPVGMPPAGKLIDEAGLKGLRVGGAQVSEVHANFLVNCGNATAQDFLDLMGLVQAKVNERFRVWLEPEVCILT